MDLMQSFQIKGGCYTSILQERPLSGPIHLSVGPYSYQNSPESNLLRKG